MDKELKVNTRKTPEIWALPSRHDLLQMVVGDARYACKESAGEYLAESRSWLMKMRQAGLAISRPLWNASHA